MSHNEAKVLKAVHHVVHDYTNLVSAGTLIYQSPRPPLNSHVQYSFIVQCRKFAHFFKNKVARGGADDILAEHFVGKKVIFKFKEWSAWDDHMDKHIFHLSYGRVKNTRPWTGHTENREMLDEFRAAWRLFLSKLPAKLKAEFDKEIANKLGPESEFRDLDLR
jgi:hypothetical protein